MELWEQILAGIIGVAALWLFLPGLRKRLDKDREAEKDWPAVIVPILVVIAFVVLLIMIARSL